MSSPSRQQCLALPNLAGLWAVTKVTNLNLSPVATTTAAGISTNAPRDIKPPIEIISVWTWIIWALVLVALAIVAIVLWKYWQKRRAQALIVPPVPPHVRARQRLNQAMNLIHQPREFCIAVSDIVRWYLEERFDFRAPERTTEEFLRELQATELLTANQKDSLRDFLERCDLVKFARYEPAEPELRDLHTAAFRLVEETEPKIVVEGAHVAGSPAAVVEKAPTP